MIEKTVHLWKMPVGIFFYSKIIFQHSNIFTGHLQKKRARGHLQKKRARGHLFLFPNIFSVFKYFYRASSEKKSLRASLEEKSPWASFSIPKYFFSIQIFLQGIFRRKEPMGIFFYSQIFYSIQILLQGFSEKRDYRLLFLFPNILSVFKYFYRASSEKKEPMHSYASRNKYVEHAKMEPLVYWIAHTFFTEKTLMNKMKISWQIVNWVDIWINSDQMKNAKLASHLILTRIGFPFVSILFHQV